MKVGQNQAQVKNTLLHLGHEAEGLVLDETQLDTLAAPALGSQLDRCRRRDPLVLEERGLAVNGDLPGLDVLNGLLQGSQCKPMLMHRLA